MVKDKSKTLFLAAVTALVLFIVWDITEHNAKLRRKAHYMKGFRDALVIMNHNYKHNVAANGTNTFPAVYGLLMKQHEHAMSQLAVDWETINEETKQ